MVWIVRSMICADGNLFFNRSGMTISRTAEMIAEMESEIAALQSRISEMKQDLGLEQSSRSAMREAAALISTMTTYVEELHPRYLKGYGSIPDPLSRYLKECLKGLSQTLNKINGILKVNS